MFTSPLIEDTLLLTVTLIDAALVSILLLMSLRPCEPGLRSYILAFLTLAAIAFLSLHEQILDISDPIIEHFKRRA